MSTVYDVYSHITYCMNSSDIDTVIVNGKIVVENGKATTLDEGEVLDKAKVWSRKIQEE